MTRYVIGLILAFLVGCQDTPVGQTSAPDSAIQNSDIEFPIDSTALDAQTPDTTGPSTPDSQTPDTAIPQDAAVPDTATLDTTGPKTPDSQKPDTVTAQDTVMTDTETPDTTGPSTPDSQKPDAVTTQDIGLVDAETPDTTGPNTPDSQTPDTVTTQDTGLPDTNNSDTTGPSTPDSQKPDTAIPDTCGNGTCGANEDKNSCCEDCADCCTANDCTQCTDTQLAFCTQGTCSCKNLQPVLPICGDKQCAPGKEDCGTCPTDCPCPTDKLCSNNQCVDSIPTDVECTDLTPNCSLCAAGETCVLGQCAPAAFILTTGDNAPTFVCPKGYTEAGHWRTPKSQDIHTFQSENGWAYLCSAMPESIYMAAKGSDCGEATTPCSGTNAQGDFHVGQGCQNTIQATDGKGISLTAGWMRLCVTNKKKLYLEAIQDACGGQAKGCSNLNNAGQWQTVPSNCDGLVAVGQSGQSLKGGNVGLCVDSKRYPPVSPNTLNKKALFGYQGWFTTEGDGSGVKWKHWTNNGQPLNVNNATIDLWPDVSELDPDERFNTALNLPNGKPAQVFSSAKEKTVRRHFSWMAESGIDGVFLQRFVSELKNPKMLALRNTVTSNVCAGATEHGRAFALMYDISGVKPDQFQTLGVETIIQDWEFLVDEFKMTSSKAYLQHDGKPVVAIWGLGFNGRPGTVEQATELLDYFQKNAPQKYRAYVMGGVPYHWRTSDNDSKPGFLPVYEQYDLVSPWSVGRYNSNSSFDAKLPIAKQDMVHASEKNLGYAPVVWPGFSWTNLKKTPESYNQIPRHGGKFFWHQVNQLHSIKPTFLYVAMFDEVDESTAMFKAATSQAQVPQQGQWLHLGQDGYTLPSNWYLRLGGAAANAMAGQHQPAGALPYPPP